MSPSPYRVLCVDDDDDTCWMLSNLLGSLGCDFKSVGGVGEALQAAGAEGFDLFILDSRLRDGSGIELCRQLRLMKPHTPIIFYSGLAHDYEKEQGIEAGASAYVVKPEIKGLLSAVERVMRGRESVADGVA